MNSLLNLRHRVDPLYMEVKATEYGASWDHPRSSAGVIRAKGIALRCDILPAEIYMLVASTILADIYCKVTGQKSISNVKANSNAEVAILTKIYMLACGHVNLAYVEAGVYRDESPKQYQVKELEEYANWGKEYCGDEIHRVLEIVMMALNVNDRRFQEYRGAADIVDMLV